MIGTSRRNRPSVCQRRSNCHEQCDYSALSKRNEALGLESLEEHRRVARGLLPRHGGREVKTTGDGFLLEFPSALAAVQGAVEIQSALHERNQVSPPERQLRIRIDSFRRRRLAAWQPTPALQPFFVVRRQFGVARHAPANKAARSTGLNFSACPNSASALSFAFIIVSSDLSPPLRSAPTTALAK